MKKIITLITAISLITSCKKTENKSTNTTKKSSVDEVVYKKPIIQETVENFTDSFGNNYKIEYITKNDNPKVTIISDNFKKTLPQTTAWAKGAEYELGDYKLVSKGDKVTLFIKEQKITLAKK